jgi:hypothetical protein
MGNRPGLADPQRNQVRAGPADGCKPFQVENFPGSIGNNGGQVGFLVISRVSHFSRYNSEIAIDTHKMSHSESIGDPKPLCPAAKNIADYPF